MFIVSFKITMFGDMMDDKNYWENYYNDNPDPVDASTFAQFVIGFLNKKNTLIELGCGNGRDSIFFAENGINVIAVDQVESELDYLNDKYGNDDLIFKNGDFTNLAKVNTYDYVYSRFTLHSITEEAEGNVFDWVKSQLNEKGLFLFEVRSINDPMLSCGEKLSDTENVTTHYRRYLDLDETISKLEERGFDILYKLESDNLSVYGDDNPVLIRIVAKK